MTSRPRVIPVLLLRHTALVKTVRFGASRYIGDPINAVRIFSDLHADELVLLDIDATRENRSIPVEIVRAVGSEATMPLAVGGGIRSIQQIRDLLSAGAEKVVLCTKAVQDPLFVRDASLTFGAPTIVVCLDVRERHLRRQRVWSTSATVPSKYTPAEFAKLMQDHGAGELIVQAVDRDGMMSGYDVDTLRRISDAVTIPVIALGGAGNLADLRNAYSAGRASALAAGSLFVHHGRHRGVLISYPTRSELPF